MGDFMNFKKVAFLDTINIEMSAASLTPTDKIGAGCGFSVYKINVGPKKLVIKSEINGKYYSKEEMAEFLRTYYEYQAVLYQLGIQTAFTVPHFIRQSNGTYKLIIIQEQFDPGEFLDQIVVSASKEEVIALFIGLINLFLKLAEYNKRTGRSFGLDFKLEDLALRNGELILVDNVPLNDGYTPYKTTFFIPFTLIPLFDRNFSDLYDNIFMLYLNLFSRRRELDKELKDAIKSTLPGNLYNEFRRKIMGKIHIYKIGKHLRILQRLDTLRSHRKSIEKALGNVRNLYSFSFLEFLLEKHYLRGLPIHGAKG